MSKLSRKSLTRKLFSPTLEKIYSTLARLPQSHLFAILLLIIVSGIVYYNSFQGSWHFDDELAITQNHIIKKIEHVPHILRGYRGVLQTTFALNYYFGGLDIFGYHLVNLVLHLLVSILIYFILYHMISIGNSSAPSSPLSDTTNVAGSTGDFLPWRSLPLFSALLFAIHPINTESVTYIISRSSVLTTLFYLLAFFLFIKAVGRGKRGTAGLAVVQKSLLLIGSLAAFILGVGTKEIIITLPAMLLLYLYYFVSEDHNPIAFIKSYKWSFLALISAGVGYFAYRHLHYGGIISSIPDIRVRGFYVNFLTEMNVIVRYYLRRLFLPIGLNIDPDFPLAKSFLEPATFFSALVIAGAIFLAIRSFKIYRIFSFFVLWFFITLTPTSSFIPLLDVAAEHRVYLPGVGFSVGLTFVFTQILAVRAVNKVALQRTVIGVFSMVILLFSIGTIKRNSVYRSPLALWTDTVRKSPHKARPHNNLGDSYEKSGRLKEAMREYTLIVEEIDPNYMRAYYGIGNVYEGIGKPKEAIEQYKKALWMNPKFANAQNNLAMAYEAIGMREEAIEAYKKALEIDPNFTKAYNNLAIVYAEQKMYEKALSTINEALSRDPGYSIGYVNLGQIYLGKGDYDRAEQALQQAVKINPHFAHAYGLLGSLYLNYLKDNERALFYFRKALDADPDMPQAEPTKAVIKQLQKE